MKQHTPGPWKAIAKPDPDPSEGTHWIQCGIGALGYWRGHKQRHDDSNWVLNEADARLIAAAPELLEFAQEVRRTGDTRLASMAIAVIAKATGEQQ